MRFRHNKYQKPLGITAREGARTGHIEIPWVVSEAIATAFVDHFDDNCTDNRVKPPPESKLGRSPLIGGNAIISDAATGQPVPVQVVLAPSQEAFHETSLPVSGLYDPVSGRITISPTFGACRTRDSWKNVLQSAIRHELTHAADPNVYLETKKLLLWRQKAKKWLQQGGKPEDFPSIRELPRRLRPQAESLFASLVGKSKPSSRNKDFCQYIRSIGEQKAFMTQVGTEMILVGGRLKQSREKGFRSPAEAIKALSPTYREIERCLTPKIKNKFMKMAARLWDNNIIPKA